MSSTTNGAVANSLSFPLLFLAKAVLLLIPIVVVWALYAYLHVYRLDWLGWFYAHLLPVTNWLYALIENYFPAEMKYQVRAAISEDLGQRSLFLLLLSATVEL